MIWNEHSELKGRHAQFSASKWSWINYDIEQMIDSRCRSYSITIGTILHEYCSDKIKYLMKVKKSDKQNLMFELLRNGVPPDVADCFDYDRVFPILMAFVNDSIGFHMESEQLLFYSYNFFGTADSICYRNRELKIFDFKSGETPAHIEQLEIYAAYFCLEYDMHPTDLDIELRLYQSPEILVHKPDASDIVPIMDKAITFEKYLNKLEG